MNLGHPPPRLGEGGRGGEVFFALLTLFLALPTLARAESPRLHVEPAAVTLRSSWDRWQLVVTAHSGGGRLRDTTHEASYAVADPSVVAVSPQGVVTPKKNGRTSILVRANGGEARVPVEVSGADAETPVSFTAHAVPLLTKLGCNSGACHGSPSGKNGFRLSLRGFDPALDVFTLTREMHGRRIDPIQPDASLLLQKATARTPHEGGRRLDPDSSLYTMLRAWVGQGARDDTTSAPRLTGLNVFPKDRILDDPEAVQQLSVVATFADGTRHDVTHLTRLSVNAENLAAVTPEGRVEKLAAGEVTVIAEYRGRMATARVTFLPPAPQTSWRDPPANNYIDKLVFAKLRRLRIEPSGLCTDAEFLRRACLDLNGRIPSPEEVRRFLFNRDPDRRNKLIDELLERPEFADWWALKWADRLGCNQRFVGKIGAVKYHAWIRQQMSANIPEDEFARAVLTGGGGNYSHPAASFWRRLRYPQMRAEEVSQLFLGVRITCARCHNHPGESITQDEYHALGAFFARLAYRDGPFFAGIYNKEETVYATRDGEAFHPRTDQPVKPKFLGGPVADLPPGADRRDAFAAWLTSPENPYFARAAANRIWFHLFGRGIVDPVDDFRSTNPPSNPELLDALAQDFVKHGYDRKHLIRTIARSRTYQLSWKPTPTNAADEAYFSHCKVRRLGAEALLDAISQATGVPEKFDGFPLGTKAISLPDGEHRHPFLATFGRPARAMACECERENDSTFTQGLYLVGGLPIQEKCRDNASRPARLAAGNFNDGQVTEELFLATLSRFPTDDERAAVGKHLAKAGGDRRKAIEDVIWALINHKEFLFER